jgi:hypothetical protein
MHMVASYLHLIPSLYMCRHAYIYTVNTCWQVASKTRADMAAAVVVQVGRAEASRPKESAVRYGTRLCHRHCGRATSG